jgi:predicted PolB exonuclease-like 3'-5' exonuclease
MGDNYFILDIETAPLKMDGYFELPEEEQKKLLNPIDSKVVAIGIRSNGVNKIIMDEDEKKMLQEFWWEWRKNISPMLQVVGFNILHFDIPFLVTRSFVHNVQIVPFVLKSIVDLREKVNAYRHGPSRGTLKEFAEIMGLPTAGMDGSEIAKLYSEGYLDTIKQYLSNDLETTEGMYKRLRDTNILSIAKW